MRPSGRSYDEIRHVSIEPRSMPNAEGSCLVRFGSTAVICTATVDNSVPPFLRGQGSGWVTAEYSMLPRATAQRVRRESTLGKLTGRTQEIQRLIGRSLRAGLNLESLGERQIIIDCDVVSADGGTRTAAITGGYVALSLAIQKLLKNNEIKMNPIKYQIAAISCGMYKDQIIADLNFEEDNEAQVDGNFVLSSDGNIIEVQASAEKSNMTQDQFLQMLELAKKVMVSIFKQQEIACSE